METLVGRSELDSQRISLILFFLEYHAGNELNEFLKQKSIKLDNIFFLLDDFDTYEWLPQNFLCQDFLNKLPQFYLDSYLSGFFEHNASEVKKSFVQSTVSYILNKVILEKKLVNYVEEIIKLTEFNICSNVIFRGFRRLELKCTNLCVGEKCIRHDTETAVCFL